MDMDTNEITINRIVGFEWDEAGTDLEDEMPTPVSSPVQIVAPVIPPAGTADPFGRGDGFDFDLAKVMCDVSVIAAIITPLEDSEVPPPSRAAEYAAPATPDFETVVESPGYTVPEESGFTWIPGFVPVSETVLEEEGGYLLSLEDPPPHPVPTSAVTPAVNSVTTEPVIPMMPPTLDDKRNESGTGSVRQTDRAKVFVVESIEGSTSSPLCQDAQDIGPDLTREGPFDACEAEPEPGQSPLMLNSMPGCQFRMTSYDDRDIRDDLDPAYGIHLHDPRMMEYMGAPESARLLGRSPEYWLEHMGRDRAVSAALRLHHDARLIMTNVQVMSQFVTSLNRTASEVMRAVYAREPFPTDAVNFVTPGRRVRRAAHYMAAMGLWRPTSAPVFPGPSRSPPATPAWPARTVSRTLRSNERTTSRPVGKVYIRTLNIVHVIFGHGPRIVRHSMLQLCSVVIFDNLVVLVSGLLVVFHTDFLLCNKSDRYIYIVGLLYGAGCPVGG